MLKYYVHNYLIMTNYYYFIM